jgi:bacterial leucyl aminopeptidase
MGVAELRYDSKKAITSVMESQSISVVFFDIGDTLGSPVVSSPPSHLESLNVYPYIPNVLQQLKDNGIRIGILSNTGNETKDDMKRVLEEAQIYSFFEPNLLIYSSEVGIRKPSPEIFRLATKRAGYADEPKNCLFVGEDSKERKSAVEVGLQITPHPILVIDVLKDSRLRYIRVTVSAEQSDNPWRSSIKGLSVVPLYVTGEKGNYLRFNSGISRKICRDKTA